MAGEVLVTRRVPEKGLAVLRAAGLSVTVSPHGRPLTVAELHAQAAGCDGLLTMLTDRVDAALLAAAPRIRAVSNFAVGTNNVDVAACTARRVGVANTPGVLTDATAEIAFALVLACARRLDEGERLVRSGSWEGWEPLQLLGVGVVGKTLGLIGPGRIAARVARMARGFDMQLLYCGRSARPEWERDLAARRVDLDTLLAQADFVSLHCPLTDDTRHLIGSRELALMKPTAVLINTARGPVVDEAALVTALRTRRIFAAGLDVYEHEPTLAPGLTELENVVLLPHVGSATVETRDRMSVMAAENLVAMLAGRRPTHAVNGELWG